VEEREVEIVDTLVRAHSPSKRLKFAFADVTIAAKALEARHLSGPTAAMAVAESLVVVSLISAEARQEEEVVSLRLHVNGPIRGILVEAASDGSLRGFANVKVLNQYDGLPGISTDLALGSSGSAYVVSSLPGRILSRASIAAVPPRSRQILARYYNYSAQVPTGAEINVRANAGGLVHARGMYVQRMPDADMEAFVQALERIEDGLMLQRMEEPFNGDSLGESLGLRDVTVIDSRAMQFRCRCSKKKTLAVLGSLTRGELEGMVRAGSCQRVVCHMCGQEYSASPDDLRELLEEGRAV
jgi:molecular chaperone Hsp33